MWIFYLNTEKMHALWPLVFSPKTNSRIMSWGCQTASLYTKISRDLQYHPAVPPKKQQQNAAARTDDDGDDEPKKKRDKVPKYNKKKRKEMWQQRKRQKQQQSYSIMGDAMLFQCLHAPPYSHSATTSPIEALIQAARALCPYFCGISFL